MKKLILSFGIIFLAAIAVLFNYKNFPISAKGYTKVNSEVIKMDKNISQVRASHILVVTEEEAKQIKKEIAEGKDFSAAAMEYSKCPSKAKGGDLGYFGRGMMVPEFDKAAFDLPVGQVSDPVKTQFGWHLILVTDKK